MKKVLALLFLLFCFQGFAFYTRVFAQDGTLDNVLAAQHETTLEAKVTKILEEKQIIPAGGKILQIYQKLQLTITSGSQKGQKITIENGNLPSANNPKYLIGDMLIITYDKDPSGNDVYFITDYVRYHSLIPIFLLFIITTIIVGRWRGFTSLLGLATSLLIIVLFILPQLAIGADPMMIAILGSLCIVPVTFYLSHGFNRKTTIAVISTFITIVITGILAAKSVDLVKLTGFASEEAGYLQAFHPGIYNIKGLLLAGIIIGTLGILNDITVSQAALVAELVKESKNISFTNLYRRAMNVGHDHIASAVNTLILVYTGASLPLLLLFIDNPRPLSEIVNYEFVADEIVRTLVGSIGLILAVPITTFLAALVFHKKIRNTNEKNE